MRAVSHSLERTNPKGVPFIGRCVQCGMTGLPAKAAKERCSNPGNVSSDDAVIAAILGPRDERKQR
jgi:hypothetical protein